MTKFHINAKGVPAPCKATEGNCPFGGADGTENHFDSHEAAQEYANGKFEGKHGLLSGLPAEIPQERRVDLYHATSAQVLNRIIEDGQMSTPASTGLTSNGLGFDPSAEENGIYLADSAENVSIYLDGAVDNGTFDFDLPNCGVEIELYADSDNLIADVDDFEGENPEDATWEDSIDNCNQVVHVGNIDSGQIKSVTFKAPFDMGQLFKDKKGPIREMMNVRKKMINGEKMSLDEALEVIQTVNEKVRSKYS